jgi:branched-chain amino acid aminotransferase
MGTAAVIAPIGKFSCDGAEVVVNNSETGPVASHLFKALTDIQYGRVPDPYGWTLGIKAGA